MGNYSINGVDTYTVYNPEYLGFEMATIDEKGNVLFGIKAMDTMIDQVRRGIATEKVNNIRCVPTIDHPKERDVRTLKDLLSGVKPRGKPMPKNLTPITEESRFKGKVNWEEKRPFITVQLRKGFSIRQIARKLGISPSTLSMANRKHGLYETRKPPILPLD
jgi:hypothetical protein